ncbi:bacteriophage holin [Chlamydiota bacterium]
MYAKLNPLKLGLAGAIIWGLFLFIMTWLSMYTGYGMFWLSQWIDIYPGFDITALGSFIGLVYGLVDGFVGLFLLGWVYNLFKP